MIKNKKITKPKTLVKDYATLIPLRGGSKGIPRKNLICINGEPLFSYVVRASLEANVRTIVSTEDEEIKITCKTKFPDVEIIDRPENLAEDSTTTEEVIEHFLKVDTISKHILLLQATSPLTTSENILDSIKLYKSCQHQPLVSVVKTHAFMWNDSGNPVNYDPFNRPRRQDWLGQFQENGAIYIFSREHFSKNKCRASRKCSLFEMKTETLIEIDEVEDAKIVSYLLKSRYENKNIINQPKQMG